MLHGSLRVPGCHPQRVVCKAEPGYPVDMVHYRFMTADGQEARVAIPAGLGVKV